MDFTIDFTEIVIAALGIMFNIIAAVITKKVIPLLKERGLDKYAKALVSVAYTMFANGSGVEKFDYAFQCLEKSEYGKYFDEDRIKQAIQSAYVELCTELGVIPSPANAVNFIKENGE